jgi:hypothetical protein
VDNLFRWTHKCRKPLIGLGLEMSVDTLSYKAEIDVKTHAYFLINKKSIHEQIVWPKSHKLLFDCQLQ